MELVDIATLISFAACSGNIVIFILMWRNYKALDELLQSELKRLKNEYDRSRT